MGDTDGFDDDVRSSEDADPSFGSDHLVELLADLRRRLEAVAPVGEDPRPDATELIRQAQERIVTLERMLAWAHAREAELTARTVRGEMRVAHLESTVGELNAIAKRATEAESGRLRAETEAAESQQHLTDGTRGAPVQGRRGPAPEREVAGSSSRISRGWPMSWRRPRSPG